MHKDFSSATKVCTVCQQEKAIDEFAIKVKATGQRQYRCRACQKAASRAHYEQNKDAVKARTIEARKEKTNSLRAIVEKSLSGKQCACGCKDSLTYVVNEGFDGPRVSAAVNSGLSEHTLRDSMANSTIMCSQCMYLKGAANMMAYTEKKLAGNAPAKSSVTKAEYKARHTRVRIDLRSSASRQGSNE